MCDYQTKGTIRLTFPFYLCTLSNNEITSSNDPIQSFFFHLALSQPLFPVCGKSLLSVANYLKCLNIQGAEKKSNWKKKTNPGNI